MSNPLRYSDPPVVEVAASAQFDSLDGLLAPHLGLIWEKFREDFPELEQHGPLPISIERKSSYSIANPSISISNTIATPRVWLKAEDGAELVQIQSNRFIRNWRKQETPDRKYPHYEPHIRPSFLSDLQKFRDAVQELGFGELKFNQCELTYFNHIFPNEVWSVHSDIRKVLRMWSNDNDNQQVEFESAAVKLSKEIYSKTGEFLGRLHFDLAAKYHSPLESPGEPIPIFACSLMARGRPMSDSGNGIVEFFDIGRSHIQAMFEKIFSAEIQKAWGKKEPN